MKRTLAILIAFAMAAVLTSCGSSEPVGTAAVTGAQETNEVPATAAKEPNEETAPQEEVMDNRKKDAAETGTVDNRKNQAKFTEDDFEITGEYIMENDFASIYFVGVKNNSEAVVSVTGNATAKDSSGNMIGADSADISVLGPGEESVLYFYLSDVKGIETMEVSYDYKRETYYYPVIGNLNAGTTLNDRNVTVIVTNAGEINAQFVEAYALFLDGNENLISYSQTYVSDNDSEIKVGAAQSVQLDCYEDYDHVKLFFTGRSDGTATEAAAYGVSSDQFEVKDFLYEDSFSTSYYVIIKNNSDSAVAVTGNAVAYDADHNSLGADNISIDILGAGEETIGYFYFSGVKGVDHAEYNLTYTTVTYYKPVISNLSVEKSENGSNVVITITNNGEYPAQYVEAYVLLYDTDGNVIGCSTNYFTDDDSEIKPGASISQQINTYKTFDHSEIYLTGRYYG